ncbi:sodium-dependent glucose transporter 1A [Aplysia californica]|uniref:Sodium-dependent glucose transporter 1A n=1 Tax=Aplysia californica TaxID=6500 RepID=A0ABM0JXF5_APLCA|nr:sodium-dependent glucose transporter 1A [Aplysia californica]
MEANDVAVVGSNHMGSEKVQTPAHWWIRLKEPDYRRRVTMSLLIAWTIFILGTSRSLNGSTFLDLQIITNTDVEAAAAFFTAYSVGFLIGSIFSGVISKKVNRSLTLFLGLIGIGGCAIVTPYCPVYIVMILVRGSDGMFSGVVDTTSNAEHMRLWGDEGGTLLQLIHFAFSAGGLLSPLYTEPFLAPQLEETETNTTLLASAELESSTTSNFTQDGGSVEAILNGAGHFVYNVSSRNVTHLEEVMFNSTHHSETRARETDVHWAYLITGLLAIVGSIPLAWMFFRYRGVSEKRHSGQQSEVMDTTFRKLPRRLFAALMCLFVAYFVSYSCMEDTFISFLMTFAVLEFSSMTKSRAAYINAIFWASSAAARFFAIFVSRLLSPIRMLGLCAFFVCSSFIGLSLSAVFDSTLALSIFVATSGLGLAAVMASTLMFLESELLHITGPIASYIFVLNSLGKMVNPILLSFLMEEISTMWYSYMLLIYFSTIASIFLVLLVWNRSYLNKRFGFLRIGKEMFIVEGSGD